MSRSAKIDYFYNSEIIVLTDPVAQYQVRLDGELKANQTLTFNINGTEFNVSGPMENYELISGDGYSVFRNGDTYLLNLRSSASNKIFEPGTGKVSVALSEEDVVLDTASGRYETYASKVVAEGDFVPLDLVLTDETYSKSKVLDETDTKLAIIEVGALWCAPTIGLAEDIAAYTSRITKDFTPMTFLLEGYAETSAADAFDANFFVSKYDLDFPVYTGAVAGVVFNGGYIPSFLVVDQITGEVLKTFTGVESEDTGAKTADEIYAALAEIEAEGDTAGLALKGGKNNDLLTGSARADEIHGRGGADEIAAGIGNDLAFGSRGRDWIAGGRGMDELNGGRGRDILYGEQGDDDLSGGGGADVLIGGLGNDVLDGMNGDDLLFGGRGNDVMSGGDGDDRLFASRGDDTLEGGSGADSFTFRGSFATETILDFDVSEDRLSFLASVTAGLSAAEIAATARVETDGVRIELWEAGEILLLGLTDTAGLEAAIEILA